MMKFNFEKIHKIRKEKGFSVTGLCRLVGISRTTLWKWEHMNLNPTEKLARRLAEVLNISLSEISNIEKTAPVSQYDLSNIVDSWLTLTGVNDNDYRHEINNVINVIRNLENKLNQSVFIIKALLDSMETMFYIKDINLKYLTANNVFLRNISYEPSALIKGKDDYNFFSQQEAKENTEQDRKVLKTGTPILREEGLIPGTRKRRWGLISKLPAFDKDEKIVGIVGTFVDITERKKSEETRELLEKILDTVPIVINIFDKEAKKVIYGNKEADRIFKEQRNYYSKKTVLQNFNNLLQTLRNKTTKFPKRTVYEFKTPSGESKWREDICSSMNYQDKQYFLRIERDYTDMKKVQVENELYREMFNEFSLEDNVITWAIMYEDINKFQVCYLSNEFETVTGYPRSRFIEKSRLLESYVNVDFCMPEVTVRKSIFSVIHPRYRKLLDRSLKANRIPQCFIFKLITAQKNILTVETSVFKKEIEGINSVYFGKAKILKKEKYSTAESLSLKE
ncbi:MAG: PAS domain-containing protein [Victivallales bacterium]|nr:PAS domain-containing protein [Victivallales bacterium]